MSGGIWESEESMHYCESELVASIAQAYQAMEAPAIEIPDVHFD